MPPRAVARLFRNYPGRWWIAGGWSLDLFLGHPTRDHEDVDVLILRDDLADIPATLPGWTMLGWEWWNKPTTFQRWLPGKTLDPRIHDIWCRPPGAETWRFQLMVMPSDGDRWVFRRDERVSGPFSQLSDVRDGIPVIAPEVQLLFKARVPHRDKDAADLRRMIPRLSGARQAWLREHVALLYPDSPALELMDGREGTGC
jgi:hypothetical protein